MKTTNHHPKPNSEGNDERIYLHAPPPPDHFKDRQKLPALAVVAAKPAHIVPANELDLANFYHL